jgi:hypothetical protein
MLYKGTRINTGDISRMCEAFVDGIRSGIDSLGATEPLPKEFETTCDDGKAQTIFQYAEEFLQSRIHNMLTNFVTKSHIFKRDDATGDLVFVASSALEYMQKAHLINDSILGAMFLGTGMPSRASELTTILYCGDSLVDRQLFLEPSSDGPIIRTRVSYNKVLAFYSHIFLPSPPNYHQVNNSQHKEKPILRFAFPELSRLILHYLVYVGI